MPKRKIFQYALNGIAAVAFLLLLLLSFELGIFNRYYRGIMILICINAIVTIALNLATGLLGELALGHAGFMAVGAYTAALVSLHSGLSPYVGLAVGVFLGAIMAGVAGVLVGIPALRLRGDYLAIITLAFGEIITIVARTLPFTGGARGLTGIPLLTNLPIAYAGLLLTIYVVYAMIRSRHGRAILAIREDDIAAEASGINTTQFKMLAFVVSAMLAGLGGGLFAHYQGILNPDKFNFNYSIDFMVMVVFGGMGSVTGSIFSAIVLTYLPELLRNFGLEDFRMLFYAVTLIILMIFRPAGLFGQNEMGQRAIYNSLNGILNRFNKKMPALPFADESVYSASEQEALIPAYKKSTGVGGSSAEAEENKPAEGSASAEADSRVRKDKRMDDSSDKAASDKRRGRR